MAKTRDQMVTIVADAIGKSRSAAALSGALLGDRCVDFLNWGQQRIARSYNFDELNINQESAVTVADIKRYPMITGTNNLGLIRPKDIASLRLIDSHNSTTLKRVTQRYFDIKFPQPTNYATGRPDIYIRYGNNLEFFRIPNDAYTLYIRYPRWAADLDSASQTSDFEYKDQLIISAGILEGYLHFEEYNDVTIWAQRFTGQLSDAIKTQGDMDWVPTSEPFASGQGGAISGEPWIDPYIGGALQGYPD